MLSQVASQNAQLGVRSYPRGVRTREPLKSDTFSNLYTNSRKPAADSFRSEINRSADYFAAKSRCHEIETDYQFVADLQLFNSLRVPGFDRFGGSHRELSL